MSNHQLITLTSSIRHFNCYKYYIFLRRGFPSQYYCIQWTHLQLMVIMGVGGAYLTLYRTLDRCLILFTCLCEYSRSVSCAWPRSRRFLRETWPWPAPPPHPSPASIKSKIYVKIHGYDLKQHLNHLYILTLHNLLQQNLIFLDINDW